MERRAFLDRFSALDVNSENERRLVGFLRAFACPTDTAVGIASIVLWGRGEWV